MECLVCSTQMEKRNFGTAPVGGQKFDTLEESLAAPSLPLDLMFCPKCTMTHYRLVNEADAILDKLYAEQPATYSLLSSVNPYLTELASSLSSAHQLNEKSSVLEIGCNDGELLSIFKETYGCEVTGVEPGHLFKEAWAERDLNVINSYFDSDIAAQLKSNSYDLIVIRHVLEHIKAPVAFLANVAKLVSPETLLVIESPYLPAIIKKRRFENMSYSHLNYFTTKAVNTIVKTFQLGITTANEVETDGGSIVLSIRRGITTPSELIDSITGGDLDDFMEHQSAHGEHLHSLLKEFSEEEVVGYGAGAKGPHLVALFGLDKYISRVIDDNQAYRGRFIAGTRAQVVSRDEIDFDRIKLVLNLAPTHSEAVRSKLKSTIKMTDIV